jgi:hypothetical protein
MFFVHVGKTGGSTVSIFLKKNNISFSGIHVHSVIPGHLYRFDKILIPVRDPMSRIISAYKYRHPVVHTNLYCYITLILSMLCI